MPEEQKTRFITMTDSPPVKIVEAEWPVIAEASADDYQGNDYARRQQALAQGEVERYTVKVRQHADGRHLVYAVRTPSRLGTTDWPDRAGVLLKAGAHEQELMQAIARVCEDAVLPGLLVRLCIADLPAKAI